MTRLCRRLVQCPGLLKLEWVLMLPLTMFCLCLSWLTIIYCIVQYLCIISSIVSMFYSLPLLSVLHVWCFPPQSSKTILPVCRFSFSHGSLKDDAIENLLNILPKMTSLQLLKWEFFTLLSNDHLRATTPVRCSFLVLLFRPSSLPPTVWAMSRCLQTERCYWSDLW